MDKEKVLKQLGLKMFELRILHKMTVYDVAEFTSVSRSTYSTIEHGKSDPPWTTMLQLCKLYDVPMSYFLEDTEDE